MGQGSEGLIGIKRCKEAHSGPLAWCKQDLTSLWSLAWCKQDLTSLWSPGVNRTLPHSGPLVKTGPNLTLVPWCKQVLTLVWSPGVNRTLPHSGPLAWCKQDLTSLWSLSLV